MTNGHDLVSLSNNIPTLRCAKCGLILTRYRRIFGDTESWIASSENARLVNEILDDRWRYIPLIDDYNHISCEEVIMLTALE